MLVDVIWPAEFASKKMIVDITDRFPESERSKIFAGALKTTEYDGRYYGVPWILDTKYFFYNKKMLGEAGEPAGYLGRGGGGRASHEVQRGCGVSARMELGSGRSPHLRLRHAPGSLRRGSSSTRVASPRSIRRGTEGSGVHAYDPG